MQPDVDEFSETYEKNLQVNKYLQFVSSKGQKESSNSNRIKKINLFDTVLFNLLFFLEHNDK